jgi:WD40 repeat protein
VAFSPDGRRLASGSIDQTVKVWDAASGKELLTFRGHSREVNSVAFSPDGRRLAGIFDQTIKVWDASPLTEQVRLDREARGMIRFLFERQHSKEKPLAAIRADQTISEPLRRTALKEAENFFAKGSK